MGGNTAISSPGGLTHVKFPFTFATPGLNNGVPIGYSPNVGDILVDSWMEVDTVFNGTTPLADCGQVLAAGWRSFVGSPYSLTTRDNVNNGLSMSGATQSLAGNGAVGIDRTAPAAFTTANPVFLWASQSGLQAGLAIGGTAGAAILHILALRG